MYSRKKVLIVDDDGDARSFVEAVLSRTGWDTLEAENGEDALDVANRELPDLILLDVDMPKIDGFEAFRMLREGYATKNIPVIMFTGINTIDLTGGHSAESMKARLGVGAPDGFVEKPVDADYLMYAIGGILG